MSLIGSSLIEHDTQYPSQALLILIMINGESRRGSDHG